MLTLRKSLFAAALAVTGLVGLPGAASAQQHRVHGSPFMSQPHQPHFGPYLFANSHNRQLPAFQAAPWYLYWPYDGHFMTPAPVHAPFYGPPTGGNFPVNPYFPGPSGYYGPFPGGPAPGGVGPGSFGSYPPGGYPAAGYPTAGPVAPPAPLAAPLAPTAPITAPLPLIPQGGGGGTLPR